MGKTRLLQRVRADGGSPLLIVALISFCTLWRLPGLADPPWLNDEGTYATVGRAIVQGQTLYRQIWENKPPAIYLLYGALHVLAGPAHLLVAARLTALLAAVLAQTAVYWLVRGQHRQATALLAATCAGLGLDLPLLDGTAANAEIFLAAAACIGMALLWHGVGGGRRSVVAGGPTFLLSGIAFGLAILFKLVAGADLLAALLVLTLWRDARRPMALAALLAGVALPMGAVLVWLATQGLVGEALYATIGYNFGYVATGQGMQMRVVSLATLLGPLLLFLAGISLARRRRQDAPPSGAAACWWLALALLGALASGRSYPHYYLQAVSPAAICLAPLVDSLPMLPSSAPQASTKAGRWVWGVVLVLVGLWVGGVPLVSWLALRGESPSAPPGSNQLAYYGHFWQHLTGELDDTAYGNSLDPRVERNVAVAQYLATHPRTPHRLYIWGNTPWIYYLSGYQHAARFISAYYRPVIPGGIAQTLAGLQADPPPYVVVIDPPLPPSPALLRWLHAWYAPIWHAGDATIYLRR